MSRYLYGDEVYDLDKLGELLQHPETFGCTIDRGTNPEATRIIDAGIAVIVDLRDMKKKYRKEQLDPESRYEGVPYKG